MITKLFTITVSLDLMILSVRRMRHKTESFTTFWIFQTSFHLFQKFVLRWSKGRKFNARSTLQNDSKKFSIPSMIGKTKRNKWLSPRLLGIFFVRSKGTKTPRWFADHYYPLISLNLRWHVFIVSFLHVEEKYKYIKKYHGCPWGQRKS